MSIRVIDPIHQGEFSDDHHVQKSPRIVVIDGIGTSQRIVADGSDRRSDDFPSFTRKSLHKFHHINGDEQPVIHLRT